MSDYELEYIYNKFSRIRDDLKSILNTTHYIRENDILHCYMETKLVVKDLNDYKNQKNSESQSNLNQELLKYSPRALILDDIFHLLSLSFMAVGMNNQAAAQYSTLVIITRLLDHIKESKSYNTETITPIKSKLAEIKSIIDNYTSRVADGDDEDDDHDVFLLVLSKYKLCMESLTSIESSISKIDDTLLPFLESLLNLRKRIFTLLSTHGHDPKLPADLAASNDDMEVLLHHMNTMYLAKYDNQNPLQTSEEIETETASIKTTLKHLKKEISFETDNNGELQGGELIYSFIDECQSLLADFCANKETIDDTLKPLYDELVTMKYFLDTLMLTHRWTLRETDLFVYQKKLKAFEDLRVDGVFWGDQISRDVNPPQGQSVLLYLIRRCYSLICKLLESSEPVSEALMPVYNQLMTVRRILTDLKRSESLTTSKDLYPYQFNLMQLDNRRVDGKFLDDDGSIPIGQATVNAILAECFDICQDLKVELELKDSIIQNQSEN